MQRARCAAVSLAIAVAMGGANARAGGAGPQPPAPAPAESVTVALLPLATDKPLALYGQPVASELARALRGGGLDVVVVSTGAPVPSRARLVIDGTIASDRGGVALEIRVRDPERGAVVATLAARAPELATIDRAAAELSAKLLPAVRGQLQAVVPHPSDPPRDPVHAPHPTGPRLTEPHPIDPPRAPHPRAPRTATPAARVSIHVSAPGFPDDAATALGAQLVARVGHRAVFGEVRPGPIADADFAVQIDIVDFDLEQLGVLIARAGARVRWRDASGALVADRVVHTDTVVGSRKDDAAAVARACAAQLVEIVAPRARHWAGGR